MEKPIVERLDNAFLFMLGFVGLVVSFMQESIMAS